MVSGVNRTGLFRQEIARNAPGQPQPTSSTGETSQLDRDVQQISLELSKGASMLAELSGLAKKRSIYVDNTAEIERLTADVKDSITVISNSIDAFEASVGKTRFRNDHTRQHYANLLGSLRKQLCDLTKNFKDALYQRAQIMIQQESRRKMYAHNAEEHVGTPSGHGRRRFTLQQAMQDGQHMDIESGQLERPSQSVVANAKAEALANVQRAIGELTQIFQRVTTLVTQQDEMIMRIDADTEASLDNVISAQNELMRYYKRISSNRTLILKCFCIAVAFLIFYIMFLM